jgi:hypothetical protein
LATFASKRNLPIINISGLPSRVAAIPNLRLPQGVSRSPRTMQRTLSELGLYPVVDLHAAGLRVGADALLAVDLGLRGSRLEGYIQRSGLGEIDLTIRT